MEIRAKKSIVNRGGCSGCGQRRTKSAWKHALRLRMMEAALSRRGPEKGTARRRRPACTLCSSMIRKCWTGQKRATRVVLPSERPVPCRTWPIIRAVVLISSHSHRHSAVPYHAPAQADWALPCGLRANHDGSPRSPRSWAPVGIFLKRERERRRISAVMQRAREWYWESLPSATWALKYGHPSVVVAMADTTAAAVYQSMKGRHCAAGRLGVGKWAPAIGYPAKLREHQEAGYRKLSRSFSQGDDNPPSSPCDGPDRCGSESIAARGCVWTWIWVVEVSCRYQGPSVVGSLSALSSSHQTRWLNNWPRHFPGQRDSWC